MEIGLNQPSGQVVTFALLTNNVWSVRHHHHHHICLLEVVIRNQ